MKNILKITTLLLFVAGIFGLPHGESCKFETHEKIIIKIKKFISCESHAKESERFKLKWTPIYKHIINIINIIEEIDRKQNYKEVAFNNSASKKYV